jgi:hypothetical protein
VFFNHDRARQRQALARTLTDLFRREKRVKYFSARIVEAAQSGIFNIKSTTCGIVSASSLCTIAGHRPGARSRFENRMFRGLVQIERGRDD